MSTTPRAALERAADTVGGFAALAKRLKLTRQRVHQWLKIGVPPQFCNAIETMSGVPREELRPDIFVRSNNKARKGSRVAA